MGAPLAACMYSASNTNTVVKNTVWEMSLSQLTPSDEILKSDPKWCAQQSTSPRQNWVHNYKLEVTVYFFFIKKSKNMMETM